MTFVGLVRFYFFEIELLSMRQRLSFITYYWPTVCSLRDVNVIEPAGAENSQLEMEWKIGAGQKRIGPRTGRNGIRDK